MLDLKDLTVEGTPYLLPVRHQHPGKESHFGLEDTNHTAEKGTWCSLTEVQPRGRVA